MGLENTGNDLNRLAKAFMDTGQAQSPEEAERILKGYCLAIQAGPQVKQSPALQAALLTAVNTGRRCFLGGVEVAGVLDVPLLVSWPRRVSLAEAVHELQGNPVDRADAKSPHILIGDAQFPYDVPPFCVKTSIHGWCGGVVPVIDSGFSPEGQEFTPAGVLAGALGVSEAFQFVRGGNAYAGRRAIGFSLWAPEKSESWEECDGGPRPSVLPSRAWLIGLGHLGQAYLWTLGLLPYACPNEVEIVLQDKDELTKANDSTSILTNLRLVGRKKTRAMAEWCDTMGFKTRIVERLFSNDFRVASDEPLVALCGVDNSIARAHLEEVGFRRVMEAGLGAGAEDFLCYQSHSFPADRSARDRWAGTSAADIEGSLLDLPAYQKLAAQGVDRCGLTQLASRSVGASFVGTVTSALVIAQLIKISMGETMYEIIDGDLRTGKLDAIANKMQLPPFNPGITAAS